MQSVSDVDEGRRVLYYLAGAGIAKYWPIYLISIAFCAADIQQRFDIKKDFEGRVQTLRSDRVLNPSMVLDKDVHEIYITKLEPPKIVVDSNLGDTIAEGPSKNNSVDSIEIEEIDGGSWRSTLHTFKLLAIFGGTDEFAVLSRYDNDSGDRDMIAVRLGDSVDESTVSGINPRSIFLNDSNEKPVKLTLFEPSDVVAAKVANEVES